MKYGCYNGAMRTRSGSKRIHGHYTDDEAEQNRITISKEMSHAAPSSTLAINSWATQTKQNCRPLTKQDLRYTVHLPRGITQRIQYRVIPLGMYTTKTNAVNKSCYDPIKCDLQLLYTLKENPCVCFYISETNITFKATENKNFDKLQQKDKHSVKFPKLP